MSIFAKRLSTLKAGTGIRLTSSSGRTITGIIEENDGVESLSVKITSHVCLKYSQIIEFEENEETSFTNYSAVPSVSSQTVYQYGVPQQYVMPSPVAYQYAVPPMQMVNQNPVPQSPVSGQFPVPPTTVAYQNTVLQPQCETPSPEAEKPTVASGKPVCSTTASDGCSIAVAGCKPVRSAAVTGSRSECSTAASV